MAALPSARAAAAAAAAGGGVTRSISSAEYALLIARNLGGVAPVVAPAPAARIAKHARTWQCAHCAYITTTRGLLQRHEADRHNIGVVWHACPECLPSGEPCLYKGKNMDDVREHLRKAHNIGVKWHACDQPGCAFRTKTAGALRKHKANKHDIDVEWHHCQVPGCTFRCKQRGGLLQHGRWMHSGRDIRHASRKRRNEQPPPGSPPPPPLVDEDDSAHFNIRDWEDYPSDSDVMTSDDEDEQLRFAKPARAAACVPCAPPA
jgi:hypothetical protein